MNCPTENISHLLDTILKPIVFNTKSYIRDSPDFIEKVKNIKLGTDDWFLCLDVVSLYTNIPHDEGILSIRQSLQRYNYRGNPPVPTILKLLELVLKCNNFCFNNENYLQVKGTAMGTKVAPNYANLYLDEFEETYVYTYEKKKPYLWYHFIDDIWSLFRGTEQELLGFVEYINSIRPDLKFTARYSRTECEFLDIITRKSIDGSKIVTDLYTKPTDSHSYLDYSSSHPISIKNSIPYSQFLRIRRNCSEWEDFVKHSIKLFHYLQLRGYPFNLIHENLMKVANNEYTAEEVAPAKQFYCIVDYNQTLPDIKYIVTKNMEIADRSSSTRSLLSIPIVFGFRKPKSISDHLVRTDILNDIVKKSFPPKCNRFLHCHHCNRLKNKNSKGLIKSHSVGHEYKIPTKVTCCSSNVIYCIECIECGIQYVGQTKNKILKRMNNHLSDIRLKKETPVARHFNRHKCELNVYILQILKQNDPILCDKWEDYWIARLYTISPKGLNILD